MNPLYDKQVLLDMQEHPERYSEEQLEQAMAELDREPDTEAAWHLLNEELRMKNEEFAAADTSEHHSSFFTLHSSFFRIAAVLTGFVFLGLASLAGYRFAKSRNSVPKVRTQADTTAVKTERFYCDIQDGDTIFRFENLRLDSILAVVGRHYHRQIVFKDSSSRSFRLYVTCQTSQTLGGFVETMNVFDGFSIRQEFDTLYVESDKTREGRR